MTAPSADWVEDCARWRGRLLTGFAAHWCYDWDELPVDETTEEIDACTCHTVSGSDARAIYLAGQRAAYLAEWERVDEALWQATLGNARRLPDGEWVRTIPGLYEMRFQTALDASWSRLRLLATEGA